MCGYEMEDGGKLFCVQQCYGLWERVVVESGCSDLKAAECLSRSSSENSPWWGWEVSLLML